VDVLGGLWRLLFAHLIAECLVMKQTSRLDHLTSVYDLGCVKTQKIEKRRELFLSGQAKSEHAGIDQRDGIIDL
jgi:hypothetical protein